MKTFILAVLVLTASVSASEAGSPEFKMFTVEASGAKFWLPSTIVVKKGDHVKIVAQSNTGKGSMHGFTIDAFKIKEVADEKGKTIEFTADQAGVFPIGCHLHPAHVGAQLVVLE